MLMGTNYYDDWRYCTKCGGYVRFLLSPHAAYCVECGGRVRLFSEPDFQKFRQTRGSRRPDSGRVALTFRSASSLATSTA